MNKLSASLFVAIFAAFFTKAIAQPLSGKPAPASVLDSMRKVADWQLAQPIKARDKVDNWVMAAFYDGVMALGAIAGNEKYLDAMEKLGTQLRWRPGQRIYFADDHAIGQMYAELYLLRKKKEMIDPLQAEFSAIMAHPPSADLDQRKRGGGRDNWSWCDALFMAPPAWARLAAATGNNRFLDFANEHWWQTSDYLYDKEEHLFFRDSRFFDQRAANGKKIFWSRGNGWVIAGIARVLQFMPDDYSDRPRYVQQLRELAEKIATLQRADGLWTPSLLDAQNPDQPEVSGSSFFTFAFAWGVNHGVLDRAKYEPLMWKAWNALEACVQADGKLIHVQETGDRPVKFDPQNSEPYGAGGFLLAGGEIFRLLQPVP